MLNPLKIVFTSNETRSLYLFRKEIVQLLLKLGHEIHIVSPEDEFMNFFVNLGTVFHPIPLNTQGKNAFKEFKAYSSIKEIYYKIKPDIIFQYTIKSNIYGTLALKGMTCPKISIVPGLGNFPDEKNSILRKILYKGYEYVAQKSTEIWFLNQDNYDFFKERNWLRNASSQILPGEGVNLNVFKYQEAKEKTRIKALFLGRVLKSKGAQKFIETASIAKDMKLPIDFNMVGFIDEHPDSISLKEVNEYKQKGLISYEGDTKAPQIKIAEADIIIVPTNYREGLNRVIQEAMAIGRPVITSSVTGAGDLINNKVTGYVLEKNTPEEIIKTLQLFLKTPFSQRIEMGKKASEYIHKNHNVEFIIPYYLKAIDKYCQKS